MRCNSMSTAQKRDASGPMIVALVETSAKREPARYPALPKRHRPGFLPALEMDPTGSLRLNADTENSVSAPTPLAILTKWFNTD